MKVICKSQTGLHTLELPAAQNPFLQALYRLPQDHSGVNVSDLWCEVRGERLPICKSGSRSKDSLAYSR